MNESKDYKNNLPCLHPEHNPPTHLWIPPGETKKHVCPNCGEETIMSSPIVYM